MKLAKRKQWPAAMEEMCAAISLKPDDRNLKNDLLRWAQQCGDSPESRAALRLIAAKDKGYAGLQAVRQIHEWAGEAVTLEARVSSTLRRADIKARELSLLHGARTKQDRLEFLADKERVDEALALLNELSSADRGKLRKRTLLALVRAFAKHRRAVELEPLLGGADRSLDDPKVATALAYALATEGKCEKAVNLLSRIDKSDFTSRTFQTLLYCADQQQDRDTAETILREWLEHRPDDPLPNVRRLLDMGKRDPWAMIAELDARSAEVSFSARDYVHLSECVVSEDPLAALQVAQAGSERFPDDERLKIKLAQLSTGLAARESEQHETLKEQVLNELSNALVEAAGVDELVSCGGASALHKILLENSEGGGDGLIILARLCLSSLRVMTTRRDHKAREAPELQGPGYFSWDGWETRRARLTELTRAICRIALLAGEDYKSVLAIVTELQSLLREDSELSRSLCRLALAEANAGATLSSDIWTVALSCDDPELHSGFSRMLPEPHGKIMAWAEVPRSGAGPVPLQSVHPARVFEMRIKAFGSNFDGEVPVTVATRAEVITEPTSVTVHDGHLVSFDEESVWTLTPAGFVPPRRSPVLLQAGTRAVALKRPSAKVEITQPALLVPGVPACFSQYFHFGAQLLPRILARLHDLGNEASGLAIALPDFAAPFVSEMLELCGIGGDRIVSIPASKTVQFTNARVMNPTLDDWQCAPEDLALARTVLSAPAGQPSRRIYLKRPLGSVRSRDRALVNEAELLSIADEFGFEMVDPASMTQREQQQLFSQAKILCGPVGAALTNALYLSSGSTVVCLGIAESAVSIYPGLTLGQDVPFVLVFGNFEPSLVNSRRFPQLPYSVRPADFRKALEAACA